MSSNRGIINLIKPVGITSFQAVNKLRKLLSIKKAGHTGTLDLLATGVLPICLGRATKIIPYLKENNKEYIAELVLGKKTNTLDREGDVIDCSKEWEKLELDVVINTIKSFEGNLKQIPPMYSAVHYKGKRLYKLARKGEEVERKPRDIIIYSIDIMDINLPLIKLKINCSKGTYIRALARDIGEELKVGAYLSYLIRTQSGPFKINDGCVYQEISLNKAVNMDYYLDYPTLTVTADSYKRAVNGVYLQESDFTEGIKKFDIGDLISIYGPDDKFISINRVDIEDEQLLLKPDRVFV